MSDQVKRDTAQAAARLRRDIDRFQAEWPERPISAYPPLSFTWEALERQLAALAETPAKQALVTDLVSGTRKQAWAKPSEMVLREILVSAIVVADSGFCPSEEEASDPMT